MEEGIVDAGASPLLDRPAGLALQRLSDLDENRELGFATLLAREFDDAGVRGALELAAERLRSPVYVTVRHPPRAWTRPSRRAPGRPRRAGSRRASCLALLAGLAGLELELGGADVVEVSPPDDPSGVTAVAAANAAYELLGLAARSARAGGAGT